MKKDNALGVNIESAEIAKGSFDEQKDGSRTHLLAVI